MKKYISIIVLLLLATRVIAGEIPDDFLKSDKQEWKAYFKRHLGFPESRLTLELFVKCLKISHVAIRSNNPDPDFMTKKISLSSTNLFPRDALWELNQQNGCDITSVEKMQKHFLLNSPRKILLNDAKLLNGETVKRSSILHATTIIRISHFQMLDKKHYVQ